MNAEELYIDVIGNVNNTQDYFSANCTGVAVSVGRLNISIDEIVILFDIGGPITMGAGGA